MSASDVARRDAAAPVPIPEHLLAQIEEAVASIPADESIGAERIIEQLLAAATLDDLNQPWEGTSGRELAGRTLQIHDLIKRPSDFEDGPAIFLVVRSVDAKSGEKVTWTTSAVATIIQLAQAWRLGLFPITAEVVLAERKTKAGYLPYHLRILAAAGPGNNGRQAS